MTLIFPGVPVTARWARRSVRQESRRVLHRDHPYLFIRNATATKRRHDKVVNARISLAAATAGVQLGENIMTQADLAGIPLLDQSHKTCQKEPVRPVGEPHPFKIPLGADACKTDVEATIDNFLVQSQVERYRLRVSDQLHDRQRAQPVLDVTDQSSLWNGLRRVQQRQEGLS